MTTMEPFNIAGYSKTAMLFSSLEETGHPTDIYFWPRHRAQHYQVIEDAIFPLMDRIFTVYHQR